MKQPNSTDLTSNHYGKLTVISRQPSVNQRSQWLCRCECGKEKTITRSNLINGNTNSCGCIKKKGENHPGFVGYKEISGRKWKEIRKCGTSRHLEFTITLPYIWELFIKQNRKCALTNLPLQFGSTNSAPYTASLDRIDSTKGYVEGNVQWVHKDVNLMKNKFSQAYFTKVCKLVVDQLLVRE